MWIIQFVLICQWEQLDFVAHEIIQGFKHVICHRNQKWHGQIKNWVSDFQMLGESRNTLSYWKYEKYHRSSKFLRLKEHLRKRVVIFTDNIALLGSIRSSRSEYLALNVILRKMSALELAGDLTVEFHYVISADNLEYSNFRIL